MAISTTVETLPRVVLPGAFVDAFTPDHRKALGAAVLAIAVTVCWTAKDLRFLALWGGLFAAAYFPIADSRENGAFVRYLAPARVAAVLLVGALRPLRFVPLVLALLAWHGRELWQYARWDRATPPALSYVGAGYAYGPEAIRLVVGAADRVGAFDVGALGYYSPPERLYESPPLDDGSRLVFLRVPAEGG